MQLMLNQLAALRTGNTLIEAAIGFDRGKPVYILNPISPDLGFKEEIYGLQPIFLNGDISKICF